MAEKSLWAYIKRGMKGKWEHATRHEDMVGAGVADVSYYLFGNSWIELKEVKELPKRKSTGVNLGQWHKEGTQRHFLQKRRGWLLIRVNKPLRFYLLFAHRNLPPWEKDKRWTWQDLRNNAYYIWPNRIDFEMLRQILAVQQNTSQ